MRTRFRSGSAVHVFDAPLLGLSPGVPGDLFFSAIGGAYEYEDEHLRSRLLQFAMDLNDALEHPDLNSRANVQKYRVSLQAAIDFLQTARENSVLLYSYERTPAIANLLNAFAEGSGMGDWALDELRKKGEKGRKTLLTALKKGNDKGRILSAISMLLILFRDDQTIASIQDIIENCNPDVGKEALVLLAAYQSVSSGDK